MVAALVLGILACVLSVVSIFAFWWLAIVGLILGIVAVVLSAKSKKQTGSWSGFAITGLITGIIGIVIGGIALLIFLITLAMAAAAAV